MLFLLDLPKGEEVTILAQKKKDGESGFCFLFLFDMQGQESDAWI